MDGYRQLQQFYQNRSKDIEILTGTQNYDNALAPRNAFHTLYIQRIVLNIAVHSNGKQITFLDDSGTALQLGTHKDITEGAGVLDVVVFDFGPEGKPLGIGKNLDITQSAAGIGGSVHIDAYERPMNGISAAQMIA
ncbi:MAG: hypothetical protein JWL83_4100 [Actinomycetia bacterium]|nr:hypothetical protein [Actinomycetes bacterium]